MTRDAAKAWNRLEACAVHVAVCRAGGAACLVCIRKPCGYGAPAGAQRGRCDADAGAGAGRLRDELRLSPSDSLHLSHPTGCSGLDGGHLRGQCHGLCAAHARGSGVQRGLLQAHQGTGICEKREHGGGEHRLRRGVCAGADVCFAAFDGGAGRNVVRRSMAPVGRGHAGGGRIHRLFTAGAGPRRARAGPGEAAGRCGAGVQRPPEKPVAAVAAAGLPGREQCRSALPVHGLLRGHRDAGHGISGAVL